MQWLLPYLGPKTYHFLEKFLCFLLIFEMFNPDVYPLIPWRLVAHFVRTGLMWETWHIALGALLTFTD